LEIILSVNIEHIDTIDPNKYDELGIGKEDLIWFWRTMVLIRRFEERVIKLFEEKRLVGASHLYIGMEAIATGVMRALDKDDYIVSTYRSHGHALARGISPRLVMAELFGRATGTNKGLGGSMHASMYPEVGIMLTTAIVGSGVPVAAGLGYARKGDGPTFIEAKAYRFLGHNLRDPQRYRSRDEVESWKKRDAVSRIRRILVEHGYVTEEELEGIEAEILREIEDSVEFAEKSPILSFEELYNLIYA
jgi:TPP-dependent pyruvate/acetoin dehydrogenase alpha subunit